MVVVWFTPKWAHIARNKAAVKCVPLSVNIVSGVPSSLRMRSTKCFTTSSAVAFFKGANFTVRVSKSCITSIYRCPRALGGIGPAMSAEQACHGLSGIPLGYGPGFLVLLL